MIKQHSQQLLEDMARRCREAYIACRRERDLLHSGKTSYTKPAAKWDGGEDTSGAVHQPYWPKMAKFMIKHGLTPEHCIRVRFALCRDMSKDPPYPNQIANPTYLEEYKADQVKKISEWIEGAFSYEKAYCASSITLMEEELGRKGKPVWRSVLLDESIPLSALFRYCLARSESIDDVAEEYEIPAMTQYIVARKEYDQVWGNWIPEDFRSSAELAQRVASK